jgi:hypothetical protein
MSDKKFKLIVGEDQLRLIQKALDFYSRVGIGQMGEILDHPTFENSLSESLRPKKQIEVGDKTERGIVTEIGDGYMKTRGSWSGTEEERTWNDVQNIKLSKDYSLYHDIREEAERILNNGRNLLLREHIPSNGSWGIHNKKVDESCRIAFDLIQVIRHEFWKNNPDRQSYTVDSSIILTSDKTGKISCEIINED